MKTPHINNGLDWFNGKQATIKQSIQMHNQAHYFFMHVPFATRSIEGLV